MPSVHCSFIDNVVWQKEVFFSAIAGHAHVWRLHLPDHAAQVSMMQAWLSEDEQDRAKTYFQEQDQQRFILSRGYLRLLLSKYLDTTPDSIAFAIGEDNKPYIDSNDTRLHYNVSHSGEWVMFAISDSAVGMDIEYVNPDFEYAEILPICFSGAENDFLQNATDGRVAFYQSWTRKESVVKATGKGIDDDIMYVPCLDGAYPAEADKIGSAKDWKVTSFRTGEQYICSMACSPHVQQILFLEAGTMSR
jgi:4'-phosphopantetheinyl transferase